MRRGYDAGRLAPSGGAVYVLPVSDPVRLLLDRAEISELLARYATALDSREWDLLEQVFTADARCDYGPLGTPRGVPEIVALVRGTIGDLDATQHLLANVVVGVDGDAATADCYLLAQHVRLGEPGGEHYEIGARYHDELVRTPAGWRIAHRTLHRSWHRGNRDVVRRG